MSEVHTYPVGDIIDHEVDGEDCPCIPTVDPVPRSDGSFGWLHIHHSLDGREQREQALAKIQHVGPEPSSEEVYEQTRRARKNHARQHDQLRRRVGVTDTEQPEPADSVRVYADATGQWRWSVRAAGNHELIAASTESYVRKADAVTNLERVTGRTLDKWQESLG